MAWIRIGTQLIVHIVIFHRVYKVLNQDSIHVEPTEVVHWVLCRGFMTLSTVLLLAKDCSCVLAHLCDLGGVVSSKGTLIPNVAHHHSLPGDCRNKPIEKEQHHSVIIKGLDEESLSFLLLHDLLHGKVDVIVFSHSIDKLIDLLIVLVDTLKQSVESLDDIKIGLFELLVNFNEVDVRLDFFIALVLIVLVQQVGHVEEDLLVLSLLIVLETHCVLSKLGFQESLSVFCS